MLVLVLSRVYISGTRVKGQSVTVKRITSHALENKYILLCSFNASKFKLLINLHEVVGKPTCVFSLDFVSIACHSTDIQILINHTNCKYDYRR